jgi:hypothetical protein
LIREIETSIKAHLDAGPKGTDREADDALAELWQLSHDDDPSPALLRIRIRALPKAAVDYIDGRSPVVFERPMTKLGGAQATFVVFDLLRLMATTCACGRSRRGERR